MTKCLVWLVSLSLLAAVGCRAGFYRGPDRTDDEGAFGPPPPDDFHCERGTPRQEKSDESHHVFHVLDGATICHGIDFNKDGKVDEWHQVENGRIVQRATVSPNGGYVKGPGDAISFDAGAIPDSFGDAGHS